MINTAPLAMRYSTRRGRLAPTLAAALVLAGCSQVESSQVPVPDTPTGGAPDVKAFVLSNVYFAADPGGAQSCPQMSQSGLDIFARTLPASVTKGLDGEQRLRRISGERARQLGFKSTGLGKELPGGSQSSEGLDRIRQEMGIPPGKGGLTFLGRVFSYDSCTDPQDFVASLSGGLHRYEGRQAYGLNLDGRVDPNDYYGPDAEQGVDNELWRALGCVRIFRESGDALTAPKALFSARAPTLIELTNVDDVKNDPEVTVAVYASADPLVMSADGGVLAHASFDVDPNPALRSTTRGRIVDGVLTTEPFDVELSYKEQIVEATRRIRAARVRATIKPDGSIAGGIYGYHDVESFLRSVAKMSQLGADLSGFSCPDVWQAVHELADGVPDPATGRNTAISTALHFVGVSAYVIHRPVATSPMPGPLDAT